jgi:hypothetical protein
MALSCPEPDTSWIEPVGDPADTMTNAPVLDSLPTATQFVVPASHAMPARVSVSSTSTGAPISPSVIVKIAPMPPEFPAA